jgi:hypothetical protein
LACYRFVIIIKVIVNTIKATDVANIQGLSLAPIEYANKSKDMYISINSHIMSFYLIN